MHWCAGAASADSDGERWDGKRRGRRGRDGGGGGKRSHMAKMDPGAPIAGALLRMDEWPPDCDVEGNPLPTNVRTLLVCLLQQLQRWLHSQAVLDDPCEPCVP